MVSVSVQHHCSLDCSLTLNVSQPDRVIDHRGSNAAKEAARHDSGRSHTGIQGVEIYKVQDGT